jgi:hypothetical protein
MSASQRRFAKTGGGDRLPGTDQYGRLSTGFMGKKWDGGDIAFRAETWAAVLRVLKPGAHLVAFGGTRTYHRMACAIEDAGFEVRDTVMWIYGQGFAKSHNLNRQPICECPNGETQSQYDLPTLQQDDLPTTEYNDEEQADVLLLCLSQQSLSEHGASWPKSEVGRSEQSGVGGRLIHRAGQRLSDDIDAGPSEGTEERLRARAHSRRGTDVGPTIGQWRGSTSHKSRQGGQSTGEFEGLCESSGTLDERALRGRGVCPRCGKLKKEFEGFGTALKPAVEMIALARKPLSEHTVAANVLRWGTGAINVDDCRVASSAADQEAMGRVVGFNVSYSNGETGIALSGSADGSLRKRDRSKFNATKGRWPANVAHDGSDEVLAAFPDAPGQQRYVGPEHGQRDSVNCYGDYGVRPPTNPRDDSGSAARFFYQAKRSPIEQVVITWISESEPHQATLLVDTEQLLERAIVVSASVAVNGWSMFLSGSNIMALFRKASTCTIRMAKNSTTESKIWNWLMRSLTSASIVDVSYETEIGGSPVVIAGDGSRSLIITLAETVSLPGVNRVMSGTQLKISVNVASTEQVSAARFHYGSKANSEDRLGARHPTVKPIDLMQWLVRLVTPPKGTALDCFAGTGTTGEAAYREGFNAVLIEAEPEYQNDIRRRMALILAGPEERQREGIKSSGKAKGHEDLPLFSTPNV